jgi:hypothetical protein
MLSYRLIALERIDRVFDGQSFLTNTTIMKSMNQLLLYISDIAKAAAMQISMWRWEMQMIRRFGPNWGYKPI